MIGVLTKIQYNYGINFGIDDFFVKDIVSDASRMIPGRMSSNAAGAFLLLGLSLFFLDARIKKVHLATILLIPINILTLFSILGYLYDEKIFYQVDSYFRVSMPASLSVWMLSFAALFARVEEGPLKIFFSNGLGGATARRLLPFISVAPILLNYIRLKLESMHLFNFEIGFSLFSMCLLLLLLGAMIFTATRLDTTFFKKIEFQKKENLANLRLNMVLDSTEIGTYEWDQKTGVLTWNHYHEILFGYEPGTPQRDIKDFNQRVHHQDLPLVYIAMQTALFEKSDFEQEFRVVLPNADLRWIHSRGRYSYDENGQPLIFRGIVMDITDLKIKEQKIKESEEKFRTITNAMPQMVWSCKPSGEADYFNNQWWSYTGAKEESCLGFAWFDLVHPDDRDGVVSLWKNAVKNESSFQTEYRLRNSPGGYHWMLNRGLPIRDFSGKITQWFCTSTDIEALKQAEDKLKQAIAARDEFLSITSHELKTPLTALRLQTDLIKKSIEDEQYRHLTAEQLNFMADLIDKQINRLNLLINDMLDVTRIRSGHLSIHKENCDIVSLTEEVVERMRPLFIAGQTILSLERPKNSIMVYCDKMRIEQIITNLLTNGLRYGEGRPVSLKIEEIEGKTILSVKDHGVGVEKHNQERIFNRFERVLSETSIAGIGLGLFIVKELVRIHGGKIWLDSELGKGSTFYVQL